MNKLIYTTFFFALLLSCNSSKEKSNNDLLSVELGNVDEQTLVKDSISKALDNVQEDIEVLPIHGELTQESLDRYFPEVTDTIKDLRIIGSEKIDLNPGEGILVSVLHNTATFDQMIVCTHDCNLNLIDNLYIGKATNFDKTSHSIEYKIIDKTSMRFDQVDWGYVEKGDVYEIDTVKYESYTISINDQGQIKKK